MVRPCKFAGLMIWSLQKWSNDCLMSREQSFSYVYTTRKSLQIINHIDGFLIALS
jgi:hypothetical protein